MLPSAMIDSELALLLKKGELEQIKYLLNTLKFETKKSAILKNLIIIFEEEVRHNLPVTIFDHSLDLDTLVEHYVITKLLLRRFDFDLPEKYQEDFHYYCLNNNISEYFISHIIERNMFYPEDVCIKLNKLFTQKEA